MSGLVLGGVGDAHGLLTVGGVDAVVAQYPVEGLVGEVVLLNAAAELVVGIAALDGVGRAVHDPQPPEIEYLVSQGDLQLFGQVLVALDHLHVQHQIPQQVSRPPHRLSGGLHILQAALQLGRGHVGAGPLQTVEFPLGGEALDGTAQGSAVEIPHLAHLPLGRELTLRGQLVLADIALNLLHRLIPGPNLLLLLHVCLTSVRLR